MVSAGSFLPKARNSDCKEVQVGAQPAVRTMKIRNVACGMCHLEGCREITAQDRQFFTIVKAHFRVSGEKETVL